MSKKKHVSKTYDTDSCMKSMWVNLKRDFTSFESDAEVDEMSDAFKAGISTFRMYEPKGKMHKSVYGFRCEYQLENLLKRYTFADDLYTAEERERNTIAKFLEHQATMSNGKPDSAVVHLVLQKARKIVKSILGDFSLDELYDFVQHGRRAAYGVPAKQAYTDCKAWNLSGTRDQHDAFKAYVDTDAVLRASESYDFYKSGGCRKNRLCKALKMSNVPKSYKIDRGITPTTVIGALLTGAMGRYIRSRMKPTLDITILQELHKVLARRYSKSKKYVTADLRNASNSYAYWLVNALVPRSWYRMLKSLGCRYIDIDGKTTFTSSFMLMGVGFTFDLQTLLFYSIIRAVESLLLLPPRLVSVYGDDLIYHRDIHRHVTYVLNAVGFEINSEKTFVHEPFRESCGGDYYRGEDVRPFQPEGFSRQMSKSQYVPFCYKLLNGILQRFDQHEVPITIRGLIAEILRCDTEIFTVPHWMPDYSGLKHHVSLDWTIPVAAPVWNTSSGNVPSTSSWSVSYNRKMFKCYVQVRKDRHVLDEFAYYWEKLAPASDEENDYIFPTFMHNTKTLIVKVDNRDAWTGPRETISLKRAVKQPRNYRSRITGQRLVRLEAVVALKGNTQYEKDITGDSPKTA